jgi:hypothetical protein
MRHGFLWFAAPSAIDILVGPSNTVANAMRNDHDHTTTDTFARENSAGHVLHVLMSCTMAELPRIEYLPIPPKTAITRRNAFPGIRFEQELHSGDPSSR